MEAFRILMTIHKFFRQCRLRDFSHKPKSLYSLNTQEALNILLRLLGLLHGVALDMEMYLGYHTLLRQ